MTIRVTPRVKYLAELAARAERRTVSSIMEWAFEQVLTSHTEKKPILVESHNGMALELEIASWCLWDVDESDRFAKLAIYFPALLNHDEQVLWKRLWEWEALWHRPLPVRKTLPTEELEAALDLPQLRTQWELLQQVAAGTADASLLPPARPDPSRTQPDAPDVPTPGPVAVRRA